MPKLPWTTQTVAQRLEEAASTLKRLPDKGLKPQGYGSSWPSILREYWESYGLQSANLKLGPPTPEAIDRMDETLEWFRMLEPDEIRLVWAVASKINRKFIASSMGVHRTTLWREWSATIRKLTAMLNMHYAA
uniref:DUF6362 domain-containing protein n=1 Tax=Magnetococcus massalia (strain MO-1) TaxID=451514 RepID=A0A1S7LLG3_MAGMO|nr:Conserved protein of unknown function [Candidatus Magnetococcus massalia]